MLAVVAVLLVVTAVGCTDTDRVTTTPPTTQPTSTVVTTTTTTTTAPTTTTTTTVSPTTRPGTGSPTTTLPPGTVPPRDPGVLRRGDEGSAVLDLQRQLVELGYWLGEVDGRFGSQTEHAVVALQKVAGLERSGLFDEATRAALVAGRRPVVRSSVGRVVEIDLSTQVLTVVTDGRVEWVFDTSTGRVAGTTPVGQWTVERQIDGYRRSSLGLLYRPKYFHSGVAVHGYTSVPPYPASHGCVRVTYPAMDAIWAGDLMPLGTPVWVI